MSETPAEMLVQARLAAGLTQEELARRGALPRLPADRARSTVTLPIHLNWSAPGRRFNLANRSERARVYEIVLREGGPEDVITYVDGVLLIDLWDELVLPRDVRAAWSSVVRHAAPPEGRLSSPPWGCQTRGLESCCDQADEVSISVDFRLADELADEVCSAKQAQRDAEAAQTQAADRFRKAVRRVLAAGLSKQDTARVLGISAQRVSQLVPDSQATVRS